MRSTHFHRLYLPAGGRDEYRLWNLTGLGRASETCGVVATLKSGTSYAIFRGGGTLMLFLLAIFGINGLQHQRSIIVVGMWAMPIIAALSTAPARGGTGPDPEDIPEGWGYAERFSGSDSPGGSDVAQEAIRCPGPRRGAETRRS